MSFQNFEEEGTLMQLVSRYENHLEEGEQLGVYMDAEDFMSVVHYYIDTNALDKAEQALRIALRQHPEDEDLLLLRVEIYIQRFDYKGGLSYLQVINLQTMDWYYYLLLVQVGLLQFDAAVEAANVLMQTPTERDLIALDIAEIFIDAFQPQVALRYLLLGEQFNGENTELLLQISHLYAEDADYEHASEYVEKVLSIDPYNVDGWATRTSIHAAQGEIDKALDDIEYIAAIDPQNKRVGITKVRILTSVGRYDEALHLLEELKKEMPVGSVFYAVEEGNIYYAREEWEQAMRSYLSFYTVHPDDEVSLQGYLDSLLAMHKWSKVISEGEAWCKMYGFAATVGSRIADAYWAKRNIEEAKRYVRKCMRAEEDNVHFMIMYGSLCLDRGEIEQAERYFRKAYKQRPRERDTNLMMAYISFLQQRDTKMMGYVQAALQVDSEALEVFIKMCPEAAEKLEQLLKDTDKNNQI